MTTDADRTEAAQALNRRILALARQHDHLALLALDADPETAPLLALLTGDLASAALVHLEGARAWRRRKEEANQRRLAEARAALDGFDLVRARSLLFRIEEEFLSSPGVEDRDAILLEFEARTMETEELQETAEDVIDEYLPRWRRWLRKRR
ncbi:MAG: hypothetical protein P1T08_06145 [Acidimicrobiia bacterium]|nr:hypothetical protein [Acidimicrobiia bacterium]